MLPTSHLWAFAVVAFVVIAVPGPSVMFTISRALTIGRRGALLTVVGNAVGECLQVVAVAFGIGALVERSILAYTVIKLVGAAYLIYLGVQAIRHRHKLTEVMAARMPTGTRLRVAADGFLVGVTNPKTIVFFVAALPQFVDRGAGDATTQILALGAVFPCIALICDGIWAFAAGTARTWFARSPRRMATIGGAGGLAMIGIGATLAVTGRKE
ncbi:MAG: LysE family translocator [Candidatus Dormibacteraeota bacterium]|uniref:LysE family translocator n=1 Tax=Candidatus Dormiibacter inghamiae TaxID=3127013 RepID=A0A934KDS6_9BACT|nr:LysE family translocator [Candidatus Dormibacteraeota bacterium]MBJ7607797.1 LysE family translocator [Candidatus Dormibacteraeota bacterium]